MLDIFRDAKFSEFCAALNAKMKHFQSEGVRSCKCHAEVIMAVEEKPCVEEELLGYGYHTPEFVRQ